MMLEEDRGELSRLERDVVQAMQDNRPIATNVNSTVGEAMNFGDRVADRVAAFGGSWSFIGLFSGIVIIWMAVNLGLFLSRPFDPYPFILLNLVLSSLAALQAPVIMMSQNRKGDRDRLTAEQNYRVNLKSELEIRLLHSKVDEMLQHHWGRLLKIQQIQIDMLQSMSGMRKRNAPAPDLDPSGPAA